MYGYIYKTTNLINGKVYIGQKKGVFKKIYLGSGLYLRRAVKKYGEQNFKAIQIASAETFEELQVLEKFYIKKYKKTHKLYNLTDGGDGVVGEQQRNRILLSYKDPIRYAKAIKFLRKMNKDPEVRRKKKINNARHWKGTKGLLKVNSGSFKKGMIPWNKGKHPEYVQGKNHPMYGKRPIPWNKNKKNCFSKETIEKSRLSHKGIKPSIKTKKKMSISATQAWKRRKEKISCLS